jgi:hypothetical protein
LGAEHVRGDLTCLDVIRNKSKKANAVINSGYLLAPYLQRRILHLLVAKKYLQMIKKMAKTYNSGIR